MKDSNYKQKSQHRENQALVICKVWLLNLQLLAATGQLAVSEDPVPRLNATWHQVPTPRYVRENTPPNHLHEHESQGEA